MDLGWSRSSLAFFHEMPAEEVRGLLPMVAEAWSEQEFAWLQKEAKTEIEAGLGRPPVPPAPKVVVQGPSAHQQE